MKNISNILEVSILRQKAEQRITNAKKVRSGSPFHLPEADTLKLIHELKVNQVGLEMINKELMLASSAAHDAAQKITEIYDIAPSGYLTLSKEGMIVEVNLNGANMLGIERSLLKNSQFGFFISNDTRPIFNLFLDKVLNSNIIETCEVALSTKGDLPIYVYLTGIVSENKEQCLLAMVDITKIKQAQEGLTTSEIRYRKLFESAKDGILILDAESGLIEDANPSLIEILGSSKEELLSKKIWEIGLFKEIAHNEDEFKRLEKDKDVRLDDLLFETAGGRKINAEFVSNSYSINNKKVMQCNIRDITKRKQAEINLKEKNEQLEAQFELNAKINDELLFQNNEKEKRAAELIIANKELLFQSREKEKRAAELIIANKELLFESLEKGKRAAELIIANNELVFQNKEKEKRAEELIIANKELVIQNREKEKHASELIVANEELLFQNKEKKKRAAELIIANKELLFQSEEKEKRAAELFIANQELLFQNEEKEKRAAELIIANKELAFQNKEKEKRAAELIIANKELRFQNEEKEKRADELIIALERAESADRLKSIFLATMSHELRTPLNSIIGFSGILMQETPGPLNEEQKKQIGMVQSSGRHLLSLINVILDLSRIESGELTANNETFNILNVIEDVIKMVEPSAKDRGLSLNMVKKPKNGEIISDKQRVHQVLLNLVDNAIKFTDKGSVSIDCYKENDSLKLEVSDTGMGIKEEDLGGIFNPFTQIDNTLTRKFEGSGLGLSISQKLMELLHGTIEVKSKVGVGSTFTVTLPA